ncbi:HNH endonuclease [Robertmurraya sp. P23]|uniref:HNH endonuclease n=1 Tax=Robertmurraya sp. P23 TaxID=3436931 RepID=UPI003D9997BB
MPKKRTPSETWKKRIRPIIWRRDNCSCVHCKKLLTLKDCHIDHIVSGIKGTNKISNLRTLCRKCHVLRMDQRHRKMIYKALKDKVIPPQWRQHLWNE